MSFNKWPKRSAEKNYFMVPNEIFSIGLDFREISLYSYLLRCENRKTYQCYPSYKTIGHAIGMSENTVAKYVRQLEEKGLIYTEPTIMQSKDGKPLNGNLLYTIRPIPGVLEAFYERQFRQAEEAAARYRAAQLLEKSNAQGRRNALCAPFREEASPSPSQRIEAGCEPFSADFCRTKEKAGYRQKQLHKKRGAGHDQRYYRRSVRDGSGRFEAQTGAERPQCESHKRSHLVGKVRTLPPGAGLG